MTRVQNQSIRLFRKNEFCVEHPVIKYILLENLLMYVIELMIICVCVCVCVFQCSGYASRCFTSSAPRRSNESQCPMLGPASGKTRKVKSPLAPKGGLHPRGSTYANPSGANQAISERKKLRFALAKERKVFIYLFIYLSNK